MFKLVIQDDEGKTTVVPLIRDEITIGRKEGNTIRLTERNVSRRHARILRNNGEVQIEDLGSYNGIRVNNARIAERVSLRISDQVQIGDYKLYLKAEGVEQVDDARTMPIERIDGNGTPQGSSTEVMAAVQMPTTPIPAQTAPPAPAAQQARATAIGVADTDPAGRPVATPAQVAALTAATGYGKLVVVSSNFAGKAFDLTRPQMIVGRTDENDIVVNHRSISRNHAKVTRDPDTQRYTISDLQSSNGVRVNGQDYGKVELRRGDTVDLGHVRLRFVEPGEDFVFSRDANISDVPEAGGRKGLVVAVVLAIVVLGAVGAFFAFHGGTPTDKPNNGGGGSGSSTTVVETGHGSAVAIVGSNGSAGLDIGSNVVVEPNIDAGVAVTNTGSASADIKQLSSECLQLVTDRKWDDLRLCAEKLSTLDKRAAEPLLKRARDEQIAEVTKSKLEDELKSGSLTKARHLLDQIKDDSSYKKDAQGEYDAVESRTIDDYKARATALKHDKKCADLEKLIGQASAQGAKVADAVRSLKCDVVAAPTDCAGTLRDAHDSKCVHQFCASHGDDPHCSTGTATGGPCDADALRDAGVQSEAMGQHAQAVKQFEEALHCKNDPHIVQLTFMAACNANNVSKARTYYKKLSPDLQQRVVVMCIRNHITKDQLDAP